MSRRATTAVKQPALEKKASVTKPVEQITPSDSKKVSPWLKGFVLFHVIAITVWSIPQPPQAYVNGQEWKLRTDNFNAAAQSLNDGVRVWNMKEMKTSIFKYYLLSSGFWQYWDMFAPNPADVDAWGDAIVTYKDGTTSVYQYPRMYDLSIPMKYLKERYRKYYERVHDNHFQYTWPYFAQRIALLNYDNPANPPVTIRLRTYTKAVLPPDQVQPTKYTVNQFFTYSVNQSQLVTDRTRTVLGN